MLQVSKVNYFTWGNSFPFEQNMQFGNFQKTYVRCGRMRIRFSFTRLHLSVHNIQLFSGNQRTVQLRQNLILALGCLNEFLVSTVSSDQIFTEYNRSSSQMQMSPLCIPKFISETQTESCLRNNSASEDGKVLEQIVYVCCLSQ